MDNCTLYVKHLPAEFEEDDCQDFMKHFGATAVRYMGTVGRLKHSAFATFDSAEVAASALRRLHQLELLGTRLVVQFSNKKLTDLHPSALAEVPCKPVESTDVQLSVHPTPSQMKESEKEKKHKVSQSLNNICSKWNVEYPLDPSLQYVYPAPTITNLTNIANALATVPRFYVQVLHLMNKMNLPAPFGARTLTPPVPVGSRPPVPPADTVAPPEPDQEPEDMTFSSTEESELESETEDTAAERKVREVVVGVKRTRAAEKRSMRSGKRLRLQMKMQVQMHAVAGILPPSQPRPSAVQSVSHTDVFEVVEHTAPSKKIELKLLTDSTSANITNVESIVVLRDHFSEPPVSGGFGKLEPERKPDVDDEAERSEEELGETEFVSFQQLRKRRISKDEMKEMAVFKNYETNNPSSRLYIKNLAKTVTEKDLHRIYGNYVDWTNEAERTVFHKQLMTSGRMKGQAFITLPTEDVTKRALEDTNGYLLHDKPMVVNFARSAKPKEKDASAK